MRTLSGWLVLPHRIAAGDITLDGPRIARIQRRRAGRTRRYIAPGFIDLHLWGEPPRLAAQEPRGGTTAFLATLGPLPPARLHQRLAAWSRQPIAAGAQRLGFHLEGPWVNRRQAGALNVTAIRPPRVSECRRLWSASRGQIRLVTLAPEVPGARGVTAFWRRRGVVISCGHTTASYDDARHGIADGMRCATHLWNKMGSPHQRRPGIIGACLEDARVMVMLLVDGKHLHPTTVKLIYRVIGAERLVLVTDSTRTVPLDDDPALGLRRRQFKGKLAGTRLTMMEAVRNLAAFTGVALPEAVRAASLNPARVLGLARRKGHLAVGYDADLVVFDERFRVLQTIVGGQVVYER